MLRATPDAISASPYGLGSARVRTPSTVNALPGSGPTAPPAMYREDAEFGFVSGVFALGNRSLSVGGGA